jgi:hypothetical protein
MPPISLSLKLRCLLIRISTVHKCDKFPSLGGATCNSLGRQPQVKLRWEFPALEGDTSNREIRQVPPLRGFLAGCDRFLGLTPQAIACRPSGANILSIS